MTWEGEKPRSVRILTKSGSYVATYGPERLQRVRFEDGCVLVQWRDATNNKRMDIYHLSDSMQVKVDFDYKEWDLVTIEDTFISMSCPNCGRFHMPRTTPDERGQEKECEFCGKTMTIP